MFLIDEIIIPNSNTTELSSEIKRRYPKHKIRVYPDPSGRARKTSAAGGVTDFAILEQNGFIVIAPKAHPPVADRINEVQAMLQNAAGDRRLFVSRKCTNMIKSLDGLVYKEKTGRITSYNVCYTKLLRWALLLQGAQGVGKSYFGNVMQMILGELVRNLEPTARITSYNVCYTKLLRCLLG